VHRCGFGESIVLSCLFFAEIERRTRTRRSICDVFFVSSSLFCYVFCFFVFFLKLINMYLFAQHKFVAEAEALAKAEAGMRSVISFGTTISLFPQFIEDRKKAEAAERQLRLKQEAERRAAGTPGRLF
jgi:hypothetical protein